MEEFFFFPNVFFSLISFFFFNNFIYLFLAVLGLHCCPGFSLVAENRGYSLAALCGPLSGFSYCGTRALGKRASVPVVHRLSSCSTRV